MTRSLPLLEVAANSPSSALAAQEGGAGRVELCASLGEGGITPSYAQIAIARERLRIPLYVLVRPRGGDFLYDSIERETMCRDIEQCVRLGCDGVVVGVLDADGSLDRLACRELIDAAGPLGVTLHRAFDVARDQREALEVAISLGFERVLTSGARATAMEGAALIHDLVQQAGDRIVVMPGAGIDAANVLPLRQATGAVEFHASAKRHLPSGMTHFPPHVRGMDAGEERSDPERIRAIVMALAQGLPGEA
jgi:copper homeostasis protein